MPVTVTHIRQFATVLDDNCAVEVQTNLGTVQLLLMRLEIETSAGSGVYSLVTTFQAPPDANLKAVFYISEVLRRYLAFTWPADLASNANTPQPHLCKRYRVSVAELLTNQKPLEAVYTVQAPRYAILAAKGFEGFATAPDDRPTLANGASDLLTSRPLLRRNSRLQSDFLMILQRTAGNYNVFVQTLATDNSVDNINLSYNVPAALQAVLVPIHYERISALVGKPLRRMGVDVNGTVLEIDFTDDAHRRNHYHFHYESTAGSLESIISTAEVQHSSEFESEELRHYVPYNYLATAQEFRHYNQQQRSGGTAYSVFLPLAEMRAAKEAMKRYTAKLRFRSLGEGFRTVPVNISGAHEYAQNGQPQGLKIDYQLAYKER